MTEIAILAVYLPRTGAIGVYGTSDRGTGMKRRRTANFWRWKK